MSPGSRTPRVGCAGPRYPGGLGHLESARPAQPKGLSATGTGAACQHAALGGPHRATPTGACPPWLCQLPPRSPTGHGHTRRCWVDGQEPFGIRRERDAEPQGGQSCTAGPCPQPTRVVQPAPPGVRSTRESGPSPERDKGSDTITGRQAPPRPLRRRASSSSGARPGARRHHRSLGFNIFFSLLPLESVNISICSSPPAHTQLCSIVLAFGPLPGWPPPSPTRSQALPFPSAPGRDSPSPQFLRQPKLQLVAVK